MVGRGSLERDAVERGEEGGEVREGGEVQEVREGGEVQEGGEV